LDASREVIGGADEPSAKMASWPANPPSRPAMVCGQSVPHDEGRSPLAHKGSSYTRGHGTCPVRALSPRPMIGKEHQSVTLTSPTTGILTLKKVTIRHQLVVPLSSRNDDLPLVKHDTWVDLKPIGTSIRYTQEPSLASHSPC
jgi:hypothetical protein